MTPPDSSPASLSGDLAPPAGGRRFAVLSQATREVHRGRLFRKYLLLILSLVTTVLLASSAISLYFSYQENKAALAHFDIEGVRVVGERRGGYRPYQDRAGQVLSIRYGDW